MANRRRSHSQTGKSGKFAPAFPGQAARAHKRLWFKAEQELNRLPLRPAARQVLAQLMARAFERPHLRDVMVAYGGVRDARHREWLESRRAAGLPGPRDGLAELAKKSRSSMIRGVRQLLGSGQLAMTRGGGRTEGGTGAANMYRLANLPGVELGQLQQLAEDARVQAEPSPDFQRARQRIQEIKEAAFGQTTRGHDPPPG